MVQTGAVVVVAVAVAAGLVSLRARRRRRRSLSGRVYLVGAGPGAPDLLTVRALELLRSADAVLYDRLTPVELLKECSGELIYVGKNSTKNRVKQESVTRRLVAAAASHDVVVRLKGGDPMIFGFGYEELVAVREAGFRAEAVPGLSSATALSTAAGIPLTSKTFGVDSFVVCSGHKRPLSAEHFPEYDPSQTLAVLMCSKVMVELCSLLVSERGWPEATPTWACFNGSWEDERSISSTLGGMTRRRLAVAKPPGLLLVGKVCAAAD